MGILNSLRNKRKNTLTAAEQNSVDVSVKSKRNSFYNFFDLQSYNPRLSDSLYYAMRKNIPIIDAAILKMTRLIGDFEVIFDNDDLTKQFSFFKKNVKTGYGNRGLGHFINNYFENIITYGNAVAEVIYSKNNFSVETITNVPRSGISFRRSGDGDVKIYKSDASGYEKLLPNQDALIFTPLNPGPMNEFGASLLDSLPFVSEILLKIFHAVGENWDRIGNVHFCVNYKPDKDTLDKSAAKERTSIIASKWSEVMTSGSNSSAKDFVALGDIEIKTIGADCPIPNSQIPVRQLLEQIISKLGLPPFLLGLSWSTTERMSKQQIEVFACELEYYRCLLEDVINRIVKMWLLTVTSRRFNSDSSYHIEWKNKNFFSEQKGEN